MPGPVMKPALMGRLEPTAMILAAMVLGPMVEPERMQTVAQAQAPDRMPDLTAVPIRDRIAARTAVPMVDPTAALMADLTATDDPLSSARLMAECREVDTRCGTGAGYITLPLSLFIL